VSLMVKNSENLGSLHATNCGDGRMLLPQVDVGVCGEFGIMVKSGKL